MSIAAEPAAEGEFRRMDKMYRHQRHIYDLSRKFYLLGRDRLIATLAPPPGAAICEVGCGTGRNLVALAERYPAARLYGIDASEEMLRNAAAKIAAHGLEGCVTVRRALAEELDPKASFGRAEPFDVVIFSYALSMMPAWEAALAQALRALKPDGVLAIVDFSEQDGLPRAFRALLRLWLKLFSVEPRAGLAAALAARAAAEGGELTLTPLYRDYAILARYRRSVDSPAACR